MAALRSLAARGNLVAALSGLARSLNPAATSRVASALTQVQQRWSSYKSSPKYTTPEDYTDYEISQDPNEWKYVERVLRYKIVPKPSSQDVIFPSGFKPATASPTDYPYFIERTKNYMQPVYLKRNRKGDKKITKIGNIQGNIWELERDMKQYIEKHSKKRIASQIHEFAGLIKLKGDFVNRVKEWMNTKGF
ncbi:hypothetical protein P5V15_003661 [Pogonomyrmex californicus]